MRYKLSIDRTVNRLVPHYLSGRRFILFVQSCLYPLQCTTSGSVISRKRCISGHG